MIQVSSSHKLCIVRTNEEEESFIEAGVAKETKTMFEDKNRRVSIWIKSIQKKS